MTEMCCSSAWRSYPAGVHCLKECEEGSLIFSLFKTKMTPVLLVNKAPRHSLIGGLFSGRHLRKQQHSGHPDVEKLSKLFEDFALFHPHFCLIHLYPLSSAFRSLSVSLILFFMLPFIPGSLL
ncbi:hypothetical protein XENOCAPTIV_001747 [Xenoophorus captivus]|uniref:Uncharacterized protein n=1 Tax=Xenoophorus captivus TaxID=1517983 RepID=A0ABV0Q470_9TELE